MAHDTVRGKPDRLRSSLSFSISGSIHATALLMVAFGTVKPPEPHKSIYDAEIRPHEDHIVWYNLRDKLPEISPSKAGSKDRRPPRARVLSDQSLAAGNKDDPHKRTMVWMPDPPAIKTPEAAQLPNVVAVAPSRVLRLFAPPVEPAPPAPSVPEPPKVTTPEAKPITSAALTPKRRDFTPPPAKKPKLPAPDVPEAPKVAMARPADGPKFDASLPRATRKFAPPAPLKPKSAAPDLPEAPQVAGVRQTAASIEAASLPRATRRFTPPAPLKPKQNAPDVPAAPEVAGVPHASSANFESAALPRATRQFTPPRQPEPRQGPAPSLPDAPRSAAPEALASGGSGFQAAALPAVHKAFTAPAPLAPNSSAHASDMPDAPSVAEPPLQDGAGQATLAIAGLDAARTTEIPAPPAPRDGGFSSGPKLRPDGGTGGGDGKIVVPGLTAHEGVKDTQPTLVDRSEMDARRRLVAVLHMPLGSLPPPAPDTPEMRMATRVSSAPDPMLEGRAVYTMAIQMPNVTSYSGSWMVWFAERGQVGQHNPGVTAPVPIRKVDPRYVVSAADERIEGKVRLSAIIRKDGSIVWVKLVLGLDSRLDRSAMEALAKWEFEPARRDGEPIDVDAVFEIPFHLAPKPKK